jgi:hypothetical protein
MTLVMVRGHLYKPVHAADPAGEGTLGSGARYGRHIDGQGRWEAGRAGPTRQRSSGQ